MKNMKTTRRDFIRAMAGCAAIAAWPTFGYAKAGASSFMPNVVFILGDDVGYADLASYGGKIPTPNLDRLGREGMRFTDAHSPAAYCAPSRCSLLTGDYTHRFYTPGAWGPENPSIFLDPYKHTKAGRRITVGEIMQRAGYRTAFLGKSHLGGDVRDKNGKVIRNVHGISKMDFSKGVINSINEHGFDYSYFLPSGIQHAPLAFFENGIFAPIDPRKPADNRSTRLWNGGRYPGDNGTSEVSDSHGTSTIPCIGDVDYNSSQVGIMLTRKALKFIDNHLAENRVKRQERPFLMYFASQAIHVPHTTPKDFDGDASEINEPVEGMGGGRTGDFLYELDMQVGQLLAKLDDAGLTENTIFIFTSDNGALTNDPHNMADYGDTGHDNNGPLKGYKGDIFEGGHRVPFIVRWPGQVAPGSVSDEPIHALDWVATMYELCGQDMEEDQAMDSASLLGLITGKPASKEPLHPFMLYERGGNSLPAAIREGNWVLIVNPNNTPRDLYNLGNDLGQEHNLINVPEHRELIDRMRAKFQKYNDRNVRTCQPRTTKAFRVVK
jgi:arylsulfatase A-like enzyme